jgi:hypothetical protein
MSDRAAPLILQFGCCLLDAFKQLNHSGNRGVQGLEHE